MVYHPYLRGKQYELVTVRETAATLATHGFVPIIEPVKQLTSGLNRALEALQANNGRCILIINPQDGHFSGSAANLAPMVNATILGFPNAVCGVVLTPDMSVADALAVADQCTVGELALIHDGFRFAKELAAATVNRPGLTTSIFRGTTTKSYQKHFMNHPNRVLVRDGFIKRRNREYPLSEPFSELHTTYDMEGMTGFGDFLTVGEEYTEGGGAAYAVAIHLTYIDPDRDNEMHIFHFISDDNDTQEDPAGKFSQALSKLIAEVRDPNTKVASTSAIVEFEDLFDRGHYPGLGYVKKLSMVHHIETLAKFLGP